VVLSLLLVSSFALQFDIQLLKDALVQVSLKNPDSSSLTMLVWNTPFDDMSNVFRAPISEVKHASGVSATYSGIIMKRALGVSDFVTLRPGQSLETVLDLTKGYHFPLAGTYTVTLNSFTRVAEGEIDSETRDLLKNLIQTPVTGNSVFIEVSQPSLPLVWPNVDAKSINGSRGGTVGLVSCSAGAETDRVTQADANAGIMLSGAQSDLNIACSNRYVKWFGKCPDTTNQETAKKTVNNMIYRANAGYKADCSKKGCGGKTYAYVYPDDPTFTIHLCSLFFSTTTDLCKYDSTGGTLIHELSHFLSVGATDDYAYGTTACQNLAATKPNQAVMNGDSYEYFNEDCSPTLF